MIGGDQYADVGAGQCIEQPPEPRVEATQNLGAAARTDADLVSGRVELRIVGVYEPALARRAHGPLDGVEESLERCIGEALGTAAVRSVELRIGDGGRRDDERLYRQPVEQARVGEYGRRWQAQLGETLVRRPH